MWTSPRICAFRGYLVSWLMLVFNDKSVGSQEIRYLKAGTSGIHSPLGTRASKGKKIVATEAVGNPREDQMALPQVGQKDKNIQQAGFPDGHPL